MKRESAIRQGYLEWVRIDVVYVYEDCVINTFRDGGVNPMIM